MKSLGAEHEGLAVFSASLGRIHFRPYGAEYSALTAKLYTTAKLYNTFAFAVCGQVRNRRNLFAHERQLQQR